MILGIGIDIIEIVRIKESVDRFGDAFLNKIFTKTELDYSLSKKINTSTSPLALPRKKQ